MYRSAVPLLLIVALSAPFPTSAQRRLTGDFWEAQGFVYTLGSGGDAGRTGASLAWRCAGPTLEVVYGWDKYFLGRQGNVQVTSSVDQRPRSGAWRLGDNNRSSAMPSSLVGAFTRAAKAGRVALFTVRDLSDGETPLDAFSLMGLTRSLQRLPCSSD